MHSHALDRARFVQDALEQPPDSCIRQRAVIGAFSSFQDFTLTLGLVKRERRDLLQPADLDRAARALVEQLDQFAVNFVNLAPPVFNIHGRASRRLIPWVAACLSKRTRSPTAAIRFRRASVEVGAPRNIVSRPRAATLCRYSPASSGVRSVMSTPSAPAVAAVSANRSRPICRTGLK